MAQLKPAGDADNSADGVSAWAKAQMEESPVILPTLKFHDLVFGQGKYMADTLLTFIREDYSPVLCTADIGCSLSLY
jgi:hypothetical protein